MTLDVPLIDLDRWFNGTERDRLGVATEVDHHLQRCGFLVVTNHGVDRAVVDACRSQARTFFHQHADVKAEVAMQPGPYRGWVGPGLESNAASYGVETLPDLKEAFSYGPVDVADESLRTAEPDFYGPNIWPTSVPGLREAGEAWWRSARWLHDELLDVLSLALDEPISTLRDLSTSTTANVTINWYGPREANEPQPNQFRVGPHTDFGLLTVLDREPGHGGLQIKDDDDNWVDAPFVPDSLTINTGDLIRRWTNDRWCSNEHRVLPPPIEEPTEELISLVYFGEPTFDTIVETFDSCVSSNNPAKYPPILSRAYLDEKMAALVVDA